MRIAANRARIGEKHNRLTIINMSNKRDKNGAIIWICKCDCGLTTMSRAADLRSGSKKSCGCLNDEMRVKTHRKSPGEASFNALELRYKNCAERRGIVWNLTTNEFRVLMTAKCANCGGLPKESNVYYKKNGELRRIDKISIDGASRAWIAVNGVDRIDSLKGYTISNCQSCCSVCNMMKKDYSDEFFIEHIKKILTNKGLLK